MGIVDVDGICECLFVRSLPKRKKKGDRQRKKRERKKERKKGAWNPNRGTFMSLKCIPSDHGVDRATCGGGSSSA